MPALGYVGFVFGLGWLAGVGLGAVYVLPWPAETALLGAICAGALLRWRRASLAPLIPVVIISLALGNWRFAAASAALAVDELAEFRGGKVTLVAQVSEAARLRFGRSELVVDARQVAAAGLPPVGGRGLVMVLAPAYSDYRYGDLLRLTGRLDAPVASDGFDYPRYLARAGIRSRMSRPEIERLSSGEPSGWRPWLDESRRRVNAALAAQLPEPAAALAQGLATGERAGLGDDLREAFNLTNTSHLLAVSGMNIALVVGMIQPVVSLLRRRWLGLALTVLVIAAYAGLVGPQPSVVRAAVMGALVAWSRFLGRPEDGLNGLAIAATLMTALDPLVAQDLGFQLSFLATAGLLIFSPSIAGRLIRLPTGVRDTAALTTAAQIAVLPLLCFAFRRASPISLLVNVLVAPIIAPATIASLLVGALGVVWPPLATPVAWLDWLFLSYLELAVTWSARLPASSLETGDVGPSAVAFVYLLLGACVPCGGRSPFAGILPTASTLWSRIARGVSVRRLALVLATMAVVVWAGATVAPVRSPLVTFLDVGQGDAVLIQTPAGRTALIDGGPSPDAAERAISRRLPFWNRRLDLVVLTHPHDDHLVGLVEVARRRGIGAALESGCAVDTPAYEEWQSALRARGVMPRVARMGDQYDLGDEVVVEVVGTGIVPADGKTATSDQLNDCSLILRVRLGVESLLLTGDAGSGRQRRLLADGEALPTTVLKLPHHGAGGSLDPEFLARVRPRAAVVSVGQLNRFGHPAATTLSLLGDTPVFRTDRDGSVEFEFSKQGLRVRTERGTLADRRGE